MRRKLTTRSMRRREFHALLVSTLAAASSGCGTILYPERIGQPRGPLDWKVVALDTIGLLLFFVPGVIAFVVDFYNGTIYLPSHEVPYHTAPAPLSKKATLEPGDEALERVEATIAKELDLQLDLREGNYVLREINSLDEFAAASHQLAMDYRRDDSSLRCQSPDPRR